MKNPRREAKIAATEDGTPASRRPDGLPKGAPRRAGMKSVLIRAGVAAAIFFIFLYYVNGDTIQMTLIWTVALGGLMIPLGMILDRFAYRMALRRWERQTGRR